MKFTLGELREFLEGTFTLDDVTTCLISNGLEVESVVSEAERLKAFVVADILATRPHPDANRLQICTVNTGNGTLDIVCGGINARPGIKTVFAPVGTVIPS